MMQTWSTRAIWRAALRTGWARRSLVSLVAVGLVASACSSSDSVDESALPKTNAPRLALAVDANLASDLPPFNDGNGHGEPAGTGYRIGAVEPESLVTAALDDTLPPDQIVEASFTTNDSPKDTGYGVVCRRRDNNNYYRLGVGNDGTFAIARVQDGTSTVLTGGGKWVRDRRLINEPGTFTVRGECRGPTLRLFVDNQPIIQIADAAFDRPGGVGVFVETFALPNATITVNRLSARGFVDRSRVTDATAIQWDGVLRGAISHEPLRSARAEASGRHPGRVVRDEMWDDTPRPAAGRGERGPGVSADARTGRYLAGEGEAAPGLLRAHRCRGAAPATHATRRRR